MNNGLSEARAERARRLAVRLPLTTETVYAALTRLEDAGATADQAEALVLAGAPVGAIAELLERELEATETWYIVRHSGRDVVVAPAATDTLLDAVECGWRIAWYGGSEREARGRYAAMATALRQGGVRLYRNHSRIEGVWAPRLRTRW